VTAINPASRGARQSKAAKAASASGELPVAAKVSAVGADRFTEPGFLVTSRSCGREWFVPFKAVADDYVDFLMQVDKLSLADATAQVEKNLEFVPTWFYEQVLVDWSDVERMGRLVTTSTLFKTKKALDRRRGSISYADAKEFHIKNAIAAGKLSA
jgi:hypothetical protein